MQNMALDLDCIILSSPEKNYERGSTSLFSSLKYSLERLVSSFADEYDVYENDSQTKSITIWSNWGMDQINALSALISSDFTPKTGIEVNLRITNATLIIIIGVVFYLVYNWNQYEIDYICNGFKGNFKNQNQEQHL